MNIACTNMVNQQIRAWGVQNPRVIDAFLRLRREDFVAPELKDLAYADMMLPIGHQQTMLSPKVEAKMLDALALKGDETILEIGTGSGFFTALLSLLGKKVVSVEFIKELSSQAAARLKSAGCVNVELLTGNGAEGVKYPTRFDAIIVTGALPFLPEGFKHNIKADGKILAILGDAPGMQVTLIDIEDHQSTVTPIFETVAPPLSKALQPERFEF